ncbi:DUF445 family protein [Paenibacillus albiflavus]|uniref:DUF445 family protein n=1 Tax=Paenibacillus albiflavus TaxID=2545760 RepID=A0A4R4E8X7_9BACL|nr:DUF445 family protein [Paenibacillus albiflavus]TCZ75320.1 DUF445 family protein [Paenibacillus albiflavus]
MNLFWMGVLYVGTAGFVGGLTNHFAIKMLFHPRKPIYLWGKKLPFTPGLIPKRRDEISRSLGQVVGDHLVTSEGLASALRKPELRQGIEDKLQAWVENFGTQDCTIAELVQQYLTLDEWTSMKEKLVNWLQNQSVDVVQWLIQSEELREKQISMLLPGWDEQRKEQLADTIVNSLIVSIKKELTSLQGERMLRRITGQFMEQSGGFLGTLAGLFVDEDKMVTRVRGAIIQQLDSPSVHAMIGGFIQNKISDYERITLGEVFEWITKDDGFDRIRTRLEQMPWGQWLDRMEQLKVAQLLGPRMDSILVRIPAIVDWSLNRLEDRIESIIKTINLPKIVEEQVVNFPIEQLERIILSVSGQEFRAITWLGVVLGGVIGLIQTFIYILQQ